MAAATASTASMTKDELRSALSDAGVASPPSSARKDELVALYESVQTASAGAVGKVGVVAGPPDFSADDEEEQEEEIALATLKKKSLNRSSAVVLDGTGGNNDTSLVLGDFDVSQLTDDQLCEALIERQIQVGPIVDSTRKIYRRKLIAAMREQESSGVVNGGGGGESTTAAANTGQNGTAENGHGVSSAQQQLQNGDFSADDEEVMNGGDDGGDQNHGDNEEEEENNDETTEEDENQPSGVVKKAATPVIEQTSPTLASIRKRFMGPAATDSTDAATASNVVGGGERFTPTPRRSIHSYKVTETTRQTLTKNKDGTVTHDFDYKKETSESKGGVTAAVTSRGTLATVLRLLPGFFLLLLFLVLAYYVYTKRK